MVNGNLRENHGISMVKGKSWNKTTHGDNGGRSRHHGLGRTRRVACAPGAPGDRENTYWAVFVGKTTKNLGKNSGFSEPIGSMVLVYMLTWLGYIDGKCYIHIYILYNMDPMGNRDRNFRRPTEPMVLKHWNWTSHTPRMWMTRPTLENRETPFSRLGIGNRIVWHQLLNGESYSIRISLTKNLGISTVSPITKHGITINISESSEPSERCRLVNQWKRDI